MPTLIAKATHTDSVGVSQDTYGNLIGTVNFTLLAATSVQIVAYNSLDPSTTAVQFQMDGNDVLDLPGGIPGVLNMDLAAGDHAFDYRAFTTNPDVTTTTRGLTIVNLDQL